MEIVNIPFQKLKVVHVVRYLGDVILDVILRIKQRARLRQVILDIVIQRRLKIRGRTFHLVVPVSPAVAICTTTDIPPHIPPPQHPVPPTTPVSVYRHRNVQKSMEMNQTLHGVCVELKDVLLIQAYSVTNQAMVQEVVIKLLIQLHIQKLKVVHVVRCLEELVLRIKLRARLRQAILVSVKPTAYGSSRGRTFHRGVSGGMATMRAVCTTTQNPPPQHPVPPPIPVSVYLHRNVHESMEMNQTLQAVSVVLKDVLLLVRIATQMAIYAVILLLQCAVRKMVL